jgi:RNA-directed DNA polymerase
MQGETRWSDSPSWTMRYSTLVRGLAASILAGEPSLDAIWSRLTRTVGQRWPWTRNLAGRYLVQFPPTTRPSQREVIEFLLNDRGLRRARAKYRSELTIAEWINEPQQMRPVPAAATWDIPAIESISALADWFAIPVNDLLWLADLKGLGSRSGRPLLEHYHYRALAKPSGQIRLIEIPKPRLKEMQWQILVRILEKIPPHSAVHGFVNGRSIKTFAAPHAGRRVVLRMDLQDFFPTFPAARIAAFFRSTGYPNSVADLLAGLCTNSVRFDIQKRIALGIKSEHVRDARDLYSRPHVPQGAPTSPALANICSYRMDCRLVRFAETMGATYTRYADDLAFSGDDRFERHVDRFSTQVAAILLEEGFHVNFRKTRIMRRGVRQHLAGVVVNDRVNVLRPDFDRLKAALTNCVRHGPLTQNREAHPDFRSHLQGRVAFVEMINPVRGTHLREIFQQIQWS